MKKIILVGGTMGVGKTTVCQQLKKELDHAVFLDGDWCWDMHPFVVNDETKQMVIDNICFLLNQYIQCSTIENVIFCWVMHDIEIVKDILCRLNLDDCHVYHFSLICTPEELQKRLEKDIQMKKREEDIVERSLERLKCYQEGNGKLIDVSSLSVSKSVEIIKKYCDFM